MKVATKAVLCPLSLAIACGGSGSSPDSGVGADDDGWVQTADAATRPVTSSCAVRGENLPERTGSQIIVSSAGPGQVRVDGELTTLRQVVSDAQPGSTIALEDGTYTFAEASAGSYTGLYFTKPNITLRSLSGDVDAVVLDSAYADHGEQTGLITIDAKGVVLANLTLKRSIFHLVHLWKDADDVVIHNLRLLDAGQQFLKSSPGAGTVDSLEVSCSDFMMSAAGRDNVWGYGSQEGGTRCYTGGIDSHNGRNWTIHDNAFNGIYCDATGVARPAHGKKSADRNNMTYQGGLSEHAVHLWDSEANSSHTVVRNHISNCARGIGLGIQSEVYGGLIANNMIFSEHAGSGEHDVAISIMRGHGTVVANNTIFYLSADAYANAIEYRWDTSADLRIVNNLSNGTLKARNSATALLESNVSDAEAAWFTSASTGDLHLRDCSQSGVVGAGQSVPGVSDDYDADLRDGQIDIGADQCN